MSLLAASAWVVLLAGDPLTTRIKDASLAAQALQGPLDGPWLMRDHGGRVLYAFEISDPPGAGGRGQGAWRDDGGRLGPASFLVTRPHRLRITLEGTAHPRIDFIEAEPGSWRGRLAGVGAVALTRGLAAPRPAV